MLHLRPGAREWWQAWLRREHPDLLPRYATLYGDRSNAPKAYQHEITEKVRALADRHGSAAPTCCAGERDTRRAMRARPQPLTVQPARDAVQLELL